MIANDKLKFSVCDEDIIYLLNADYDCRICPVIIKVGNRTEVILEPGKLKRIQL